jgi:dTDP-4-dehydrorhamnose reductase
VDRAETEADLAMAVNGVAPGVLAEEVRRLGATLVHYSTDYVFDGTKATPYTEADTPNPVNMYGKTKLAGERAVQAVGAAHYILRTSWVYSAEGANFMNNLLRLGREHSELRIVDDQIGAPTWATAIASMTKSVLDYATTHCGDPRHGLYHLTASGAVTWFGFAHAIFAEAGSALGLNAPNLVPVSTAEYPLPAKRPANSRLATTHFSTVFGITPALWHDMLLQCMKEKTGNSPTKSFHE